MQLDLFNDSRNIMLCNDVLQSLVRHDHGAALTAWTQLQQEFANIDHLPDLRLLIAAEAAQSAGAGKADLFADHAALRAARLSLQNTISPVAQVQMGPGAATLWLSAFWRGLIARAAPLPFRPEFEAEHVAPMLLHLQDWQACIEAVRGIESWRRIPAPLAWMAQATLHQTGLKASWSLLAELAWLSPHRLALLIQSAPDPTLQRLRVQFDASFEPAGESRAEASLDLAWFPAWVLTSHAQYLADLAQAQPGQHSAPEQAMRLLVNLLGFERQGRHHDIIKHRKLLRDLHGNLYATYMKTR